MVTQCPHKRLHGVEPGTHGAGAPLVEKPSCPPGRCVVPEVVERLLQKIGANGAEVVLQDVGKLEGLALREGRDLLRSQRLTRIEVESDTSN